MSERELLELAAKAAGIDMTLWSVTESWNPLADDGDALRLAVVLHLDISVSVGDVIAERWRDSHDGSAKVDGDAFSATRLAIVRAAAHIGQGMP